VPEVGLEPTLPRGKGLLRPPSLPFLHSGLRSASENDNAPGAEHLTRIVLAHFFATRSGYYMPPEPEPLPEPMSPEPAAEPISALPLPAGIVLLFFFLPPQAAASAAETMSATINIFFIGLVLSSRLLDLVLIGFLKP